ncbi:MAG: hypothetical protein JO056_09685 [Alphaproteobacteria bacterium]|nr:hypothetical protein [Alphaproteobacteria bacterium]
MLRVMMKATLGAVVSMHLTAVDATAAPWHPTTIFSQFGGDNPSKLYSGVVEKDGEYYGTALQGGANGCGAVYKVTPIVGQQGNIEILHAFTGSTDDGCNPSTEVLFGPDGALYGTAAAGGVTDCQSLGFGSCGVVFRLKRKQAGWSFELLYAFKGGADGFYPHTEVAFGSNGALYGTTGGSCTVGGSTVFELAPPKARAAKWTHTVLHTGQSISARVTFGPDDALYGVESEGCGNNGSVFQLAPPAGKQKHWRYRTLHVFAVPGEGTNPVAGVIFDHNGLLFGTTYAGGATNSGTVYSLTRPAGGKKQWTHRVLHDFGENGQPDGAGPSAPLLLDRQSGTLYGTAVSGVNGSGPGIVFQLLPSKHKKRKENVLWSSTDFGDPNGYFPVSRPIFGGTRQELIVTTSNLAGVLFKLDK